LTVGSKQKLALDSGETITGEVTEMRPLGEFATWRAARAVGDHDLNSFLVRIDPVAPPATLRPGMTVSLGAAPQTLRDEGASWWERATESVAGMLRTFRLSGR